MDIEIPETEATLLRQMCGLPGTEPLPEKLLNRYRAAKIITQRVGWPIRNEYVRIVAECGFGKTTETEAKARLDVATLFLRKEIKNGHPVTVNWREQKVAGTIIGVNAMREVIVLIDGVERKVKADQVALSAAA